MPKISKPTLLLNEEIYKANIQKMADKANRHSLKFKPHMKTHQSAEIGEWFKAAGVEAITVSSVAMATYFATHGWKDITIAFPCNIAQIEEIDELAGSVSLTLLVNSKPTAHALQKGLKQNVNVYIEIDTGSGRTGLKAEQTSEIEKLVLEIEKASNLNWIGFYSHPGHSYSANSKEEILQVYQSVLKDMRQLRDSFEPAEVCVGDTPCCTVATNFDSIDAISPGNFVFYDLMQHKIGSCSIDDIAVAMACPVVDIYPARNEITIYGGAVHFSKESIQSNGFTHFGLPALKGENGWKVLDEKMYLKALSQEHGLIKCSSETAATCFSVGDIITVLPVHSCLTANLMGEFKLSNGRKVDQF